MLVHLFFMDASEWLDAGILHLAAHKVAVPRKKCLYFLYKSNINPYGSCEISNLDYIEV